MSSQILKALLCLLVLLVGFVAFYIRNKSRHRKKHDDDEVITYDIAYAMVRKKIVELTKDSSIYDVGTDEKWEALFKRKRINRNALRNCIYCRDSDKLIVKNLIKGILMDIFPETKIEKLLQCVNFRAAHLASDIKFEMLIQHYKYRGEGADSFKNMIHKYHLDMPHKVPNSDWQVQYYITEDDIDEVFALEKVDINYTLMIDVLTTMMYRDYKGLGKIDTLREMNVDGINCGTSGSILRALQGDKTVEFDSLRSVWTMFEGKQIHLRFLAFANESELKRITTLVCRYNKPGPLTEKRGFIVTTMFDKSRVLALRPPCCEIFAFFIRKFTLSSYDFENLYNKKDKDGNPIHKNAFLPITIIKGLMEMRITTVFTGRQGSGKTTCMVASIPFIDPTLTIRVLEMTFEMYLRELLPDRNILSLQQTPYNSIEDLQDALKKSDGAVTIIGEIATKSLTARFIQLAMVASLFTIASHHAVRSEDLVYAFRNDIVQEGGFSNDRTAEEQVLEVLTTDVHLDYEADGIRFIDRITEIIKLPSNIPYPELDTGKLNESFYRATLEYYKRRTDRPLFITQDIIRFNRITKSYEAVKWFTPELTKKMFKSLPLERQKYYSKFIRENFGLDGCKKIS